MCRGCPRRAQWRVAAKTVCEPRAMRLIRATLLAVATADTPRPIVVLMLIPPGCSALLPGIGSSPVPTCQPAIHRGPCLVPAIRMGWRAREGSSPVRDAHLWFVDSIFVEWFESLGGHAVDCAAIKARSGPMPGTH